MRFTEILCRVQQALNKCFAAVIGRRWYYVQKLHIIPQMVVCQKKEH